MLTFPDDQLGKRQVFPFQMADGRDGKPLTGKLTLWVYHLNKQDQLTVDINGKIVAAENIRRLPVGQRRGGLPGPAIRNLAGELSSLSGAKPARFNTQENCRPAPGSALYRGVGDYRQSLTLKLRKTTG